MFWSYDDGTSSESAQKHNRTRLCWWKTVDDNKFLFISAVKKTQRNMWIINEKFWAWREDFFVALNAEYSNINNNSDDVNVVQQNSVKKRIE